MTFPDHLRNPNLTEVQKRERKVHLIYLKNRHANLRQEFIESRGSKCEDCPNTTSLIIKHRKGKKIRQGHFTFQALSYLSKKNRQKILKDCCVMCRSCSKKKKHTLS